MIVYLADLHNPTRAEQAQALDTSESDFAIQCRRADAAKVPPYWPFAPLDDLQQRQQAKPWATQRGWA